MSDQQRILDLRWASSEERSNAIDDRLAECLNLLTWECEEEHRMWDSSDRLKRLEQAINGVVCAADAMIEASRAVRRWKEMGRR